MGAVMMRARAELRARWRTWVILAVMLGLFGGAVIAIVAGARRTDTAYPRFLRATRAWDVLIPDFFSGTGSSSAFAHVDYNKVDRLPQVAWAVHGAFINSVGSSLGGAASPDPRFATTYFRPQLIEGRFPRPDRAHEALASVFSAKQVNLDVGSRVRLKFGVIHPVPGGSRFETVSFHIVGLEAAPGEFPPQIGSTGTGMIFTQAFYRQYGHRFYRFRFDAVGLKRGSADVPAFQRGLSREGGHKVVLTFPQASQAANVERSFHLQAVALWLLAALTGLVTLLAIGQTLARQSFLESTDNPTLRSLGMTRGQLFGISMARAGLLAASGTVLAIGVAALASPIFPRGLARIAEPRPGFMLDWTALGIGAVAILAIVIMLGAIPAWRAASVQGGGLGTAELPARRPSSVVAALARANVPPSGVAGVRLALEPGRGRTAVPVRSTILSVTIGIAALSAALTFGASLTHLLHTPRLYGVNWDLEVSNNCSGFCPFVENKVVPFLQSQSSVSEYQLGGIGVPLEVDGLRVDAIALVDAGGPLGPPVLAGRPPTGNRDIVLGSETLQSIGRHIGDTARVSVQGARPKPMRIVGRGVIPPIGDAGRFGVGAYVDYSALRRLVPGAPPPGEVLVRLAPGTDAKALVQKIRKRFEIRNSISRADPRLPAKPTDIVNFGRVQNMPLILACLLGALAAAALAHVLVTSIRRRRRDLAILKTLGFVRGQVSAAVAWQATTLAVLTLALGVPLGVAAGRWIWAGYADQLGILAAPAIPLIVLLLTIAAGLLLANLIAAIPGRLAARTNPATVLRSE